MRQKRRSMSGASTAKAGNYSSTRYSVDQNLLASNQDASSFLFGLCNQRAGLSRSSCRNVLTSPDKERCHCFAYEIATLDGDRFRWDAESRRMPALETGADSRIK